MPRKKNRDVQEPIPLKLVKAFEKSYSGVWDICEQMRDVLHQQGFNWDRRCYVPSAPCMEFARSANWGRDFSENAGIGTWMCTLAAWRQYKEIYSFDADFAELLMKSATDEIVPSSIINTMPYPSFYVKIEGDSKLNTDGFFCFIDSYFEDAATCKTTLTIVANLAPGIASIPIIIEDGVSLKESMSLIKGWGLEKGVDYDEGSAMEHSKMFAEKALQLILYICAVNADISENIKQKSITRKPPVGSKPKDVLREIRTWDVGYRVGKIIRDSRSDTQVESTGRKQSKTSMKRPHTRRGHFHHFWVGSKSDGTRKLMLKWVAPMFINMKSDDLPAVINEIDTL